MSMVCPLCETKEFQSVFTDFGYDKKSYDIVKCKGCEFCYLAPEPSDQHLDAVYSTYYGESFEPERVKSHLQFRQPVFRNVCDLIAPYFKTDAKLLDIGCGTGDFIGFAKEKGWIVSGIETSKLAAEFGKKNKNLNIQHGAFLETPFSSESFDAVTILDVLEHLKKPLSTLQKVNDILTPNGVLLIRVPNTPFQLMKARLQRLRSGPEFTTMAAPLHLNHFDSKSLVAAVEKSGFIVENIFPGEADGLGFKRFLKKSYLRFSTVVWHATRAQVGNILCLVARKRLAR